MSSLLVLKYGGSSLAQPSQIQNAARQISDLRKKGHSLIVVVSAMGSTTNELTDLAYKVSGAPNHREMDMLLSTGERISMALMSMALYDLGCPAISFTGSQAGIFTDKAHSNARILDVRPFRVEDAITQGKVVVLAGFQGVDPQSKEITTLGRGGSDTTAVAIAAHMKASRCIFLKDVKGILSADPKLVEGTELRPELSYASLIEMCFWGAKVLHYRAAALAQKINISLAVGLAATSEIGTTIIGETSMYENAQVLTVNSHGWVHHLGVQAANMGEAFGKLAEFLKASNLPWPQILATAQEGNQCRLMVTGCEDLIKSMSSTPAKAAGLSSLNRELSSVTVTCNGSAPPSLAADIIHCLFSHNIASEKVLTTALSVSAFVPVKDREQAIQLLHQRFVLKS